MKKKDIIALLKKKLSLLEQEKIKKIIKETLKQYEGTIIFQMLLNIVLVKLHVRKATLIELNDLENEENSKYYENELTNFINTLGLKKIKESIYRYFVLDKKLI